MLIGKRRSGNTVSNYAGKINNQSGLCDNGYVYKTLLTEGTGKPDKMWMEDKQKQKELSAEMRRYNKAKYQHKINEQIGRRNALYYLDY